MVINTIVIKKSLAPRCHLLAASSEGTMGHLCDVQGYRRQPVSTLWPVTRRMADGRQGARHEDAPIPSLRIVPTELSWTETYTTHDGRERLPAIPGHELSGVVEAVATGVTTVKPGDGVFGLTDFSRESTRSAGRSLSVVRTPVMCGGLPERVSSTVIPTPHRSVTRGWSAIARRSGDPFRAPGPHALPAPTAASRNSPQRWRESLVSSGPPQAGPGVVSVEPFLAKIIASSLAGCVWLAFLETSCVAPGCS